MSVYSEGLHGSLLSGLTGMDCLVGLVMGILSGVALTLMDRIDEHRIIERPRGHPGRIDRCATPAVDGQLDVAAFSACLEQKKHLAAIEADRAEADRAGINATPTIIINNKLITGSKSLSGFKEIIDAELAKLAPAAAPQPTKP